jgi:hypothetical protein
MWTCSSNILLYSFANGTIHVSRDCTVPLAITRTHYKIILFLFIPVHKQWARLAKPTVSRHLVHLGSAPVADMRSRPAKKDLAGTSGPKTFQRKVQIEKNCNRNKLCAKTCFLSGSFFEHVFFPMWTCRSKILLYNFANGTVHVLPQALELLVRKCPCSKFNSLSFKLSLKFS